jgi:pseudouridine-5'-phosphate glycosidase
MGGKLKVGLLAAEIEVLGKSGPNAVKCSRRDLPFVVARNLNGATTVAATMIIAAMAGIRVFATGGIGGVHRGVEETLDISADLDELARTDVTVICAGIKSILDIPRTLEYLETRGVPVVGFGTDTLPAFYASSSGVAVDYRIDTAAEFAAVVQAKQQMQLAGGILVGVPIPVEHAMDHEVIDAVIDDALVEMQRQGIHGKATTPYLLASIAERTGGRSLEANISLILNNARVAAELAIALAN